MEVILNWYLIAIKKYFTISGRSHRTEYWYFFFFNIVFALVLGFIDIKTGNYDLESGYALLSSVYCLVMFIPGVTIGVRRLHDTGRTGWWLLIALIPFVGCLILLYFSVSKGDVGTNKYGVDPKEFDF